MKLLSNRFIATGLLGAAFCTAATSAQDTVFPPFGNTAGGSPFDIRAGADAQPWNIKVKSTGIFTQLQVLYSGRNMATSNGQSILVGDQQGISNGEVPLGPGEYVNRVDVWAFNGVINMVRFYTPVGNHQFGSHQTGETRFNFIAPAGEQVIGFNGSASINLIFSLGVITRPLLASHVRVGTGCSTSLGQLRMRFRSSAQFLIAGSTPIIESPNVPNGSAALFIYGFSDTSWAGVPLPIELTPIGSPGCFLYQSMDFVVQTIVEPGNLMAHTMDLRSLPPEVIGGVVNLQALVITNGAFRTSDTLKAMIGRI